MSARSLIEVGSSRNDGVARAPLFPSEWTVPRRRRPSDVVRLFAMGLAFVLLAWAASGEPVVDARLSEFLADLPSWLRTLAWFGYTASAIAALVLLAAGLLSQHERGALARDLVCALGVSIVLAVVAGRLATGEWPHLLPELFDAGDRLGFPTWRPTLVVTVVLVLEPYVNASVQRWMRWMIAVVVVSPVLLGLSTLTGILGSLSLSLLSVAVVRLAFGSPEGLPSLDRLGATLAGIGLDVTHLAYRDNQPGTVGLATATATDGRPLDIKVYGVDAADRHRAERVWRSLWYRRAGPAPRAGRSEQAQHEALAVLSAREAGINVPALVGAGMVDNGDVLLVSIGPSGMPLRDLEEPTEAQLVALWAELAALHERARISHGGIDPLSVRLEGDDAEFAELGNASLFPTEQQFSTDVVSLLATQAISAGIEPAVDAACDVVGSQRLVTALPFIQDAVLAPTLRSELRASGITTNDLGEQLSARLGVELPEPAPIKRVTWRDVLVAGAAILAANSLITQIADVGFDTILDELANASAGWLVAAFIINLLAYGAEYFALKAVIGRPLPFSPVVLLQSAKDFVGLVVPSTIGHIGLDVRFLQHQGVPVAVAATQGPVIGFIGFLAEILLLLLSAWAIGQELQSDRVTDFSGGGLILIAVLVVVVGIAVVMAVPTWRNTVVPFVREAVGAARSIITSPRALVQIFSAEALNRLIKAVALGATVAAFGESLPFAALVFVSVGTGLLAGLAPVPGGIGVAEATMSGLLTAAGLPPEQSVSIAIIHRFVTAYLPPVLGYFAFNWLSDEGHL